MSAPCVKTCHKVNWLWSISPRCDMAWCQSQGEFLPHTQWSQNRLLILHNPEQDKVLAKDEYIKEFRILKARNRPVLPIVQWYIFLKMKVKYSLIFTGCRFLWVSSGLYMFGFKWMIMGIFKEDAWRIRKTIHPRLSMSFSNAYVVVGVSWQLKNQLCEFT